MQITPVRFPIASIVFLLFGTSSFVSAQSSVRSSDAIAKRTTPSVLARREPDTVVESVGGRVLTLRLRPGQDLRKQIEALVKSRNIRAGFIVTAVGSLRSASIRLADQQETSTFEGKFEIVSLVGTMGQDGVHLHISIADSTGKTIGGHLAEGCLVYTTVELVVAEARGLTFSRELDEETGYKELHIRGSKLPRSR